MPDREKLTEFVAWTKQHFTGDEKGQAQIFLSLDRGTVDLSSSVAAMAADSLSGDARQTVRPGGRVAQREFVVLLPEVGFKDFRRCQETQDCGVATGETTTGEGAVFRLCSRSTGHQSAERQQRSSAKTNTLEE
jgi:hypothetical protein